MKKTVERKKEVGKENGKAVVKKKAAPKIPEQKSVPEIAFDPVKKDLVRQTIITVLWRTEEVTYPVLIELVNEDIGTHYKGDLKLYIESVKNDLVARKLMEISPGKTPPHFRLAQRLEKQEDEE
jgi:hypothetical protein